MPRSDFETQRAGFGANLRRWSTTGVLSLAVAACGGGDSPTSPPPPVAPTLRSQTLSGSVRALSDSGCAGGSHPFSAAEGPIQVQLLATTGNVDLAVQVCAGSIDTGNCSISQRAIHVGETVAGARVGGAAQTLVFNPANCGAGGPRPPGSVSYSAVLTYLE